MSMATYAFDDYGVVLNGLGAKDGKHPDFDENILEELAESDAISVQFSFTGEAFPVSDKGNPDWGHGESYDDEAVYYIPVRHYPGLFDRPYAGMKDLLDELCESYRAARREDDRLPKLTRKEIRERFRRLSGTYWG